MSKRKEDLSECVCLKDALLLVEKRCSIQTLEEAAHLLRRIQPFRVAKVVLASKVAAKFFADPPSDIISDLLENDEDAAAVWEELQDLREFPCCRGPACGKHMSSSRIVSAIAPLMNNHRLPQNMSAFAPAIEIMLQFTEVVVEKHNDELTEWEKASDWIDSKMSKIPLMTEILDPSYLLIRGPNGAAGIPRATVEGVLTTIGVGRNAGGYAVAPTAASMEVARPGAVGHNRIPDLYRFPDKADARVARVGLLMWAQQQVPVVQFDIVRLSITLTGFEWL